MVNLCTVVNGRVKYKATITASRHLMGKDSLIISFAVSISLQNKAKIAIAYSTCIYTVADPGGA